MRILHVANEAVSTGNGIVNSAVDLACLQAEAGHDVFFMSSGGGYTDFLRRHGVHHYEACLYPRSPLRLLRDTSLIKKILLEIQPEIVHAHMMTTAILMRLGRDLGGFGQYKLVTTVHNEYRKTSQLMQVGDRVIVLSDNGREVFRKRGFPERKLCVVRHGILDSPRRREEIKAQQDSTRVAPGPMIVTIAGLYKRKGIGELIHAFGMIAEEFPTASLHILGWGPDQIHFERLREAIRGSARVHFRGFVSKPHLILRDAAVFVLASHSEAFPLAVAEAREAGCAIIATTVGGIPELLEHGHAGILIPPHSPDLLAQALRRVLSDPSELEKWRSAARANLDWLSCRRMSAETMDVYHTLVDPSTVSQAPLIRSG